jgi:hypothetical protein
MRQRVGGGADNDASALLAIPSLARATAAAGGCAGGGGGQMKVPRYCCAMVVAAMPTIVPLDSRRPSLAHEWQGWRQHGLTAGAVVVVRAMAGAMARHYRPFPCLLVQQQVGSGADNSALADIQDQRKAEREKVGEDLRLDGPPMFALGGH